MKQLYIKKITVTFENYREKRGKRFRKLAESYLYVGHQPRSDNANNYGDRKETTFKQTKGKVRASILALGNTPMVTEKTKTMVETEKLRRIITRQCKMSENLSR